MDTKIDKNEIYDIPVLPTRGLTVFPYMIMHFDVGRDMSIKALEKAMIKNQRILLVAQKDIKVEKPTKDDIYSIGTVVKVKQLLKLPGDIIRVLVEGLFRAEIDSVNQIEPYFECNIKRIEKKIDHYNEYRVEALKRKLQNLLEDYYRFNGNVSPDAMIGIMEIDDISQLSDVVCGNVTLKNEHKQELLEEFDPMERIEKLIVILSDEIEILKVEQDLTAKVKKQVYDNQKEYYLREQLKAIKKELGESEDTELVKDFYVEKIKKLKLEEKSEKKLIKEAQKLEKLSPQSSDAQVTKNYLDLVLDLPWNLETKEIKDLEYANEVLEKDHYGLEKVKERILDFLAVRMLKNDLKGPILCLVGPPGVGKTSIAKSIARALNRNYVRMSLGGVRDEAEIRGHRKTYIGAMPGRIISSIRQAESSNPLILLDEIDKLGNDFRGDPASALLEVLDSEQNYSFRDHYVEIPFDLSKVMFITTCNSLSTISRPLLDRMEVIQLTGYTDDEKVNIARNYLVHKQIKNHGLKKSQVNIKDDALLAIVHYYTKESGVRSLEREISNVLRKVARKIAQKSQKSVTVSKRNIESFLGKEKFKFDVINDKDEIGVTRGLAWTPVGGDTLSVEVNIMDGSGKLELTGSLGDVMKESCKAAISFVRSNCREFDIDPEFYKTKDIHIHVPEGAIPKDGPSAGVTITTSIVSALTKRPVRKTLAMTGEVTLRGKVLAIGGLKEKSLAAYRAKIEKILIPEENSKDIEDIPKEVKENIEIVTCSDVRQVIKHALV